MAGIRSFLAFLLIAAASSATAARLPDFSFGSEVLFGLNSDPAPAPVHARVLLATASDVDQPLSPCPDPPQ